MAHEVIKALVIEDQEYPWMFLEEALERDCGIPAENITRARWYAEADEMLRAGQYDVILVDHRMPYEDPGCTDSSDFNRFSKTLDGIGYGLLRVIAEFQPSALVIGTSSLSSHELGNFPVPERTVDKNKLPGPLPELIRERIERVSPGSSS